jgi:hypothetical protein
MRDCLKDGNSGTIVVAEEYNTTYCNDDDSELNLKVQVYDDGESELNFKKI